MAGIKDRWNLTDEQYLEFLDFSRQQFIKDGVTVDEIITQVEFISILTGVDESVFVQAAFTHDVDKTRELYDLVKEEWTEYNIYQLRQQIDEMEG